MNACPNLNNKQVRKDFDEFKDAFAFLGKNDAESMAYYLWDANNGYSLDQTPNGEQSKLFQKLLRIHNGDRLQAIRDKYIIYTNEYKKEHGDWTKTNNEPESISADEILANIAPYRTDQPDLDLDLMTNDLLQYNFVTKKYGQLWLKNGYNLSEHTKERQMLFSTANMYGFTLALFPHERSYKVGSRTVTYNHYEIHPIRCTNFDDIYENTGSYNQAFAIVDAISKKFPSIPVISMRNIEQAIDSNVLSRDFVNNNPRITAFYRNGRVYVIKDRVTPGATLEEIMHAVVGCMQNDNTELFSNLLHSILSSDNSQLKRIVQHVRATYSSFSQKDQNNEIVTKALTQEIWNNKSSLNKHTFRDIINKVVAWFRSVFLSGVDNVLTPDNKYAINVSEINPQMTLNDIVKVIMAKDVTFRIWRRRDNKVYFNISPQQNDEIKKHEQKLSDEIFNVYQRLYNNYKYQHNKSINDQKNQDQLYTLIDSMKSEDLMYRITSSLYYGVKLMGNYQALLNQSTEDSNSDSILNTLHRYVDLYDKSDPSTYKYNISYDDLISMRNNIINTYNQIKLLVDEYKGFGQLPRSIDGNSVDIELLYQTFCQSLNESNRLWKIAARRRAKDAVEAITNNQLVKVLDDNGKWTGHYLKMTDEEARRYKENLFDWLLDNSYNGDINKYISMFVNYGSSSSPIIKQAFGFIQKAQTKTLKETLQRIQDIVKLTEKIDKIPSITNWQKDFMEFDKNGLPTGYFVRKYNYGQRNKDELAGLQEFNDKFIEKHGFTYAMDETGNYIKFGPKCANNGQLGIEEEWYQDGEGNWVEPTYIEWLKGREQIIHKYSNKRFKLDYYLEKYSKPYVEGDKSPGHGLSPMAAFRYDQIQNQINYYLDRCMDEKTGVVYPERLNADDQKMYDYWVAKKKQLANPYERDGNIKQDDEAKIALEIDAWESYLSNFLNTAYDIDAFNKERDALLKAINDAKTPEEKNNATYKYNMFIKYNARYGISKDFIDNTIGNFDYAHKYNPVRLGVAKRQRAAMKDMVAVPNNTTVKDFNDLLHNEDNGVGFFARCKQIDVLIHNLTKSTGDRGVAQAIHDFFKSEEVCYSSIENNKLYYYELDANGNQIKREVSYFIDSGVKMETWRDHILNVWLKKIKANPNHELPGLVADLDGSPMQFVKDDGTVMSDGYIKAYLDRELLTYDYTYIDSNGDEHHEIKPLSVFMLFLPAASYYYIDSTGKVHLASQNDYNKATPKRRAKMRSTWDYNPSGSRFRTNLDIEYSISLLNPEFDPKDPNGKQPKPNLYKNDSYQKVEDPNSDKGKLYRMLIDLVREVMHEVAPDNIIYDYRLPQLEANNNALLGRLVQQISTGNGASAIKGAYKNMCDTLIGTQNRDFDFYASDDNARINPDGSVVYTIPRRLTSMLKNPENTSSSVVEGAILMAYTMYNYSNKSAILPILQLIQSTIDPANRPVGHQDSTTQFKVFSDMVRKHVFEAQESSKNGPSKLGTAAKKIAGTYRGGASLRMLGGNILSAGTGALDSFLRQLENAFLGKYATLRDMIVGIRGLIPGIRALLHYQNPIPNCKLAAMLQLNGIGKDIFQSYKDYYKSQPRKIADLGSLLMSIFSFGDYLNNSILTRSYYNHVRFIQGHDKIPDGFYTRAQLSVQGKNFNVSESELRRLYMSASSTLWDAYQYKDGQVFLKDKYRKYVTLQTETDIRQKIEKRASLYNGANPDNDTPLYMEKIALSYLLMMKRWMIQNAQSFFAGRNDLKDNSSNWNQEQPNIRNANAIPEDIRRMMVKQFKTKDKKQKELDRFYDRSWNVETSSWEDQLIPGLFKGLRTLITPAGWRAIKNGHWNPVEKNSIKAFLAWSLILGIMFFGFRPMYEWGTNGIKKEVGMQTPEEYISNSTYKLLLTNLYYRTLQSKFDYLDPMSAFSSFKSISAAWTDLSNRQSVLDYAGYTARRYLGYETDGYDLIKNGAYKGETKSTRALYKATGFMNNIHSAFSYYGLSSNLRWYINQRSWIGPALDLPGIGIKKKGNGFEGFGTVPPPPPVSPAAPPPPPAPF